MGLSPGWPIIKAGQWIYREAYNQEPPNRDSVAWWLRWMKDFYQSPGRGPLIDRLRSSGNRYLAVMLTVAPQGAKLASIEERAPAYQSPEPEAGALFLGSGAMSRSEAYSISQQGFSWVVKEITSGRLENMRYLDLFLHNLVQVPESEMRLPMPHPDCPSGNCTDEALAVWSTYLEQTGFTRIRGQVSRAWQQEINRSRARNERYTSFLDKADRALSWVSMHRPVELLGEKIEKFFEVSEQTKDALQGAKRLLAQYPNLATTQRRQELDRLSSEMRRNDWVAYQALNPLGLWQGAAPSPLAGYAGVGAVSVTIGASALVALGIVTTGLVIYTALSTSAERTRASIASDAMRAAREEAEAIDDVFDRKEHLLRNRLMTGEISQAQYEQEMLLIAEERSKALSKNRETRERITDAANEGKGGSEGPLAPFAVVGAVAVLGYFGLKAVDRYQKRRA